MPSDDRSGTHDPIECALSGAALLNSPSFNKGSAFPAQERREFDLTGLLPPNVQTLDEQVRRAHRQYSSQPDDLAKNTFLASLKEQNVVLYYRLLHDHIKDMFSVVYTPTEGDAIEHFSQLFRRPEGCFLNIRDQDRVEHDIAAWGNADDIDYIVVTDGEEILGIGDQGVGGILISVAKLVLATLCAGVHPDRCLPVVLDCGTDNEHLLDDELYLGLRHRRVRGRQYDDFVDRFVRAARRSYPGAYIHFEDFGLRNARRLLDTYRPQMACFNDDVQGTGCVALAAIMAGLHVSGQTLRDLRMVVFGAGTAGVGIADQVRDAIAAEGHMSREEASERIWLVDRPGLLLTTTPDMSDAQRGFAKDPSAWSAGQERDLVGVIRQARANVLVGTSTVPGAFTREVMAAMASSHDRPIIMPLSNPTRLHEATPHDVLRWTDGKALCATGSPFAPVTGPWGDEGRDLTVRIAECNNSVVFPGIGLGCILSRARLLTDGMLVAAVRALAAMSPALEDPTAPLLPDVEDVRSVSLRVAAAVVAAALDDGLSTRDPLPPRRDEDLHRWIAHQMWQPVYRPLKKVTVEASTRAARGELRRVGTVHRKV